MSVVEETPREARRPGARSMLVFVRSEALSILRDVSGLVVPLVLPVLILVMSSMSAQDVQIGGGLTAIDVFVLPLVIVMIMSLIGIVNMPSFLAYYRRSGILRRLAVTPASPAMVLAAQVIVSFAQAVVGIGIAIAVAVLGFGAKLPRDPLAAVGAGLLAIAAMYAIGMIVAAVAPTPSAATAAGLVLFLGLGALGGMFGGRGALPDALADLSGRLPFGAAVDAVGAAWIGSPVDLVSIATLAVTIVVGAAIAGIFFRWE